MSEIIGVFDLGTSTIETSSGSVNVKEIGIRTNGGEPDTAIIVASIYMKIEYHQSVINKLNQAKKILL